ncbi:uncharacterized protein LOC110019609, partial [Phalaenopsis equestris]|uniref:uncharacterized protein LOC110019609 n=1 Tax=Phalaenopsis equestris TaxID=78828 RepID=UPI0009E4BA68
METHHVMMLTTRDQRSTIDRPTLGLDDAEHHEPAEVQDVHTMYQGIQIKDELITILPGQITLLTAQVAALQVDRAGSNTISPLTHAETPSWEGNAGIEAYKVLGNSHLSSPYAQLLPETSEEVVSVGSRLTHINQLPSRSRAFVKSFSAIDAAAAFFRRSRWSQHTSTPIAASGSGNNSSSPFNSTWIVYRMAVAASGQLNLDESPSWGSRGVDCFEKLEQIGEGTYG